ncbi:TIGR04255 family protein, partial [Acinetobacter baumannii]
LGLFYQNIKKEFPNNPQKTPILDIPAAIRENDKNLMYAPHYELSNTDFIIKISPQSISISCNNDYKGWIVFFDFVKIIIDAIFSANV